MQTKFFILFLFVSSFCFSQEFETKKLLQLAKNVDKIQKLLNKDTTNFFVKRKIKKLIPLDTHLINYSIQYSEYVNNEIERARILTNEGKINESMDLCNLILQKNPKNDYYKNDIRYAYFHLAKNYAFLKDTLNCYKNALLFSQIKYGDLDILFQPIIYNTIGREKIDCLAKVQDSVFVYFNKNKTKYFEQMFLLRYLIKEDQYTRIDPKTSKEQFERINDFIVKSLSYMMENNDFLDDFFIDDIHKTYFTILFAHFPKDLQLKYLKRVVLFMEKSGRYSGAQLIIDKALVNLGKEQLYGTQVYGKDGKCMLYPITRRSESEIRKELGLDN